MLKGIIREDTAAALARGVAAYGGEGTEKVVGTLGCGSCYKNVAVWQVAGG